MSDSATTRAAEAPNFEVGAAGQPLTQEPKQLAPSHDTQMDEEDEPPLTRGLEALLGGLGDFAPAAEKIAVDKAHRPAPQIESSRKSPLPSNPIIPGLFLDGQGSGNASGTPDPVVRKDGGASENAAPTIDAPAAAPSEAIVSLHHEEKQEKIRETTAPISGKVLSVAEDAPMPDRVPEPVEEKNEPLPENVNPTGASTHTVSEDTHMSEIPHVEEGSLVDSYAPLPAGVLKPIENGNEHLPEISKIKDDSDHTTAKDIHMSEIPSVEPGLPANRDAPEEEHPEWEIDSSPYESSSDDSSDESSSDESEEGDNTYKLLSPEEQARILMEGDGASDDEGGNKAKGTGVQLRTKNEVPDVVVPKPDVTITPEMLIVEVGNVEHIVEKTLVIKAKTSGEFKCLESGSVLCLGDRSVIGVVAEILGPVQKPLYSVMFTNAGEIAEAGLSLGTKVFYSEQHSTFVFTQALKAFKGSDASNLHDEEVGDEEVEFSDDEAEAEHKRRIKQKKMQRKGGQMPNGPGRGGHSIQQQHTPHDASKSLSYDDAEEDGPYRPLARPAGFENSIGQGEAPQEGPPGTYERSAREQFRGRGRGGDRVRGDRGRGRGDRGRGRGSYQDRRSGGQNHNQSNGHSLPPRPQTYSQPPAAAAYPQSQYQQPAPQAGAFSQPTSPAPPAMPNFFLPQGPYNPQMQWPQFPMQPPYHQQQSYQNLNAQMPWPSPAAGAQPPGGGAYINPAFLPGQWQQGQQGGK